jgi:hypothetical protein
VSAAVYWLYDRAERLLYVGMTNNPTARFAEHADEKPWWDEVSYYELLWCETRREAADIELGAILDEAPAYNIRRTRQPEWPIPRSAGVVDFRSSIIDVLERLFRRLGIEDATVMDPLPASSPFDEPYPDEYCAACRERVVDGKCACYCVTVPCVYTPPKWCQAF